MSATPLSRAATTAALAATGLLALGASGAEAATAIKITSPARGSLQTGTVAVRARVPATATHAVLTLDGRRFPARRTGTALTARVRARELSVGRNSVVVSARTKGGKRISAVKGFVVGQAAPTLLQGRTTVTRGHGTAALQVRFAARPTKVSITLNGRKVPLLRTPLAGRATIPLAADDGLKFGANRLKVVAVDDGTGRWGRYATTFAMSRRTPLASAGRDQRVTAGATLRLSAGASRATSAHVPLGYRWQIVSQPKGAHARLRHANTMRPTIKATVPGRYRVKLVLIPRGAKAGLLGGAPAASDTVSLDVAANVPPYGLPVTTLVPNSDGSTTTTIQGLNLLGPNDYLDTPADTVQLIVLDRATLQVVSTPQFSNNDPTDLNKALTAVTPDQIGIVAMAPGDAGSIKSVGPVNDPGSGFTIVFAGGNLANPIAVNDGHMVVGSSTSGPRDAGAISGVLRKSITLSGENVFTFAFPDALSFDTDVPDASGNGFTIQLGGVSRHFDGGGQGIAVETIGADLRTEPGWDVATLDGTADDQAALEDLTAFLNRAESALGGGMIAVQTWGNPKAHTSAWGDFGNALAQFGGTPSVWDELDGSGNYALVGRSGAGASSALQSTASAEASAQLTAKTDGTAVQPTNGTLRGVIGRGPDSMDIVATSTSAPTVATTDANGNAYQASITGLLPLAEAAPQPWPLSGGGDGTAYQWISKQLDLGDPNAGGGGYCYQPSTWDLRAEYCNGNLQDSWASTYTNQLNALTYPGGSAGFTDQQFADVKAQLDKEFSMISPVMTMFGYLQKPLLDSTAAGSVAFTNAASAVDSSLSTMPATSPYNLQGFVSMFLGPLSSVVAPEGAAWLPFAYGMLSDAINYGLTGVTDNSGNPALDTFDSKKGQIGEDAVNRLQKAAGQVSLMEQLVLTDWTKLSTAAHNATTIWSLNDWTTAQQTAMVTASTKQWLYTTMVPQAYTQMQVTPSAADGGLTIDGINTFSCTYSLAGFEQWANPFVSSGGTKLPASAAFTPIVGTNADGTPVSSYMYGLGNATGHQNLQTPSASLTDPLFQSVDNGGVGLNKEQFYTWSWDSSNRKDILKLEGKPLGYPDKCG